MHTTEPFNILLPYDGKTVLATVTEDGGISITPQFIIKFPDGYTNTFFPVDTLDDDPLNDFWAENTLGITELSKELSPILDEYLANPDYNEPYIETVDGQVYFIQPFGAVDLTFYKIYHNGAYLFSLQVGEDAQWEVMAEENDPVGGKENIDLDLVRVLGDLIEKKGL